MRILALIILAVAQLASAEQKPSVDCSGKLDTPSCKTFQTMLAANQADLRSMFSGAAYACFRTDEDTFFVVSFSAPQANTTGGSGTPGVVQYHRYKNGASDDFRKIPGTWKTVNSQLTFTSNAGHKPPTLQRNTASVDDRGIVISYVFLNSEKAEVHYTLQLRRAALDYLEVYEWQEKSAGLRQSPDYYGKCAEFR